jgi:hypothetical protein
VSNPFGYDALTWFALGSRRARELLGGEPDRPPPPEQGPVRPGIGVHAATGKPPATELIQLAREQQAERQAREREERHRAFLARREQITEESRTPPALRPPGPGPLDRARAHLIESSPLYAAAAGAGETGRRAAGFVARHLPGVNRERVAETERLQEEALGNALERSSPAGRFAFGTGDIVGQMGALEAIPGPVGRVMSSGPALEGVISPLERATMRVATAAAKGGTAAAATHALTEQPLPELPQAIAEGAKGFAEFEGPLAAAGEAVGAARLGPRAQRAQVNRARTTQAAKTLTGIMTPAPRGRLSSMEAAAEAGREAARREQARATEQPLLERRAAAAESEEPAFTRGMAPRSVAQVRARIRQGPELERVEATPDIVRPEPAPEPVPVAAEGLHGYGDESVRTYTEHRGDPQEVLLARRDRVRARLENLSRNEDPRTEQQLWGAVDDIDNQLQAEIAARVNPRRQPTEFRAELEELTQEIARRDAQRAYTRLGVQPTTVAAEMIPGKGVEAGGIQAASPEAREAYSRARALTFRTRVLPALSRALKIPLSASEGAGTWDRHGNLNIQVELPPHATPEHVQMVAAALGHHFQQDAVASRRFDPAGPVHGVLVPVSRRLSAVDIERLGQALPEDLAFTQLPDGRLLFGNFSGADPVTFEGRVVSELQQAGVAGVHGDQATTAAFHGALHGEDYAADPGQWKRIFDAARAQRSGYGWQIAPDALGRPHLLDRLGDLAGHPGEAEGRATGARGPTEGVVREPSRPFGKQPHFAVGTPVRALIGTPERTGVIVKHWKPYAQYRVRWADGHETNIDARHLAPIEPPAGPVREAVHPLTSEPHAFPNGRPPIISALWRRLLVTQTANDGDKRNLYLQGVTLRKGRAAQDLFRALHPFRDPKFEHLHAILTDAQGRIVAHEHVTVGSDVMASFVKLKPGGSPEDADLARWVYVLAERAKRLGVTDVWFSHNHPSGDSEPSWNDLDMTEFMAGKLRRQGLALRGMLVINHSTAHLLDDRVLPRPRRQMLQAMGLQPTDAAKQGLTRAVGTPIHIAPPTKAAEDWTSAGGMHLTPNNVGDVIPFLRDANVTPKGQMAVVFLDAHLRPVAKQNHGLDALGTIETWLPEHLRALRAHTAVIFAHGAEARVAYQRIRDINISGRGRPQGMPWESLRRPGHAAAEAARKALPLLTGPLYKEAVKLSQNAPTQLPVWTVVDLEDGTDLGDHLGQLFREAGPAGEFVPHAAARRFGVAPAKNLRDVYRRIGQPEPGVPREGTERVAKAIRRIGQEITVALRNPRIAGTERFYREPMAEHDAALTAEFPTMAEVPSRLDGFKLVSSLASSGAGIGDQLAVAIPIWRRFEADGRLPEVPGRGKQGAGLQVQLAKLNQLLDAHHGDWGALTEHLLEYVRGPKGEMVPRATTIFGPKVARFWMNQLGLGHEPTVDKWAIRTYRRLTGERPAQMFTVNKRLALHGGSPFEDRPATDPELREVREFFGRMTQAIHPKYPHLDTMDLQALLWFHEQDLAAHAGGRTYAPTTLGTEAVKHLAPTRGPGGALAPAAEAAAVREAPAQYGGAGGGVEPGRAAERLTPTPGFEADLWTNLRKLESDPTGEQALAAQVERVVEHYGPADLRKVRVPHEQTRAEAARAGVDLHGLDGNIVPTEARGHVLAAGQIISRNTARMTELAQIADRSSVPEPEREAAARTMTRLLAQNDHLLYGMIRSKSEGGRLLNSFKIVARQTLDPHVWMQLFTRIAERTPTRDEAIEIGRLVNERATDALARMVADAASTPVQRQLLDLWKAGLLTNPKTHVVNITSNLTMAALESAKDPVAGGGDAGMSLFTKQRTKGALGIRELVRQSWRGARQGLTDAKAAFRGGPASKLLEHPPTQVTVFGWKPANAFANAYVRVIFNSLGAEDAFFRAIAFRRSLIEQVRLAGHVEGLRGVKLRERVNAVDANLKGDADVLLPHFDDYVHRAMLDAEVATFQDMTALGRIAGAVPKHGGVPGTLLVPFTKTPGAVATRILEYSPAGLARGVGQLLKTVLRRENADPVLQRAAAESVGRGVTGSLIIALGYKLAEAGILSPPAKATQKEQQVARQAGETPSSLLVGPNWLRIGRVAPVGNLLAVGAWIHEVGKTRDQNAADVLTQSIIGSLRTVGEMPFVQGLAGAAEALQERPSGISETLGTAGRRMMLGYARSAIPAGIQAAVRGVKQEVRRPETAGEAATLGGAPIVSPASGPVTRTGGVLDAMFNPMTASADLRQRDPVIRELSSAGYAIPPLERFRNETAQQFAQRQAVAVPTMRAVLTKVMRMPGYTRLAKNEAWADQVAAELMRRNPDAHAGENRRQLAAEVLKTVNRHTRADVLSRVAGIVNRSFSARSRTANRAALMHEIEDLFKPTEEPAPEPVGVP